MAINTLNPYLNFNGAASDVIKLYERVLGAKVVDLLRYGDVPSMNAPAAQKDRVLHSVLKIGASTLMLSDSPMPVDAQKADNIHMALDFDDPAHLAKTFDALSDGGKVLMPVHDTFYGGKMGVLVDAHGVSWMFNFSPKK